jgi:two-component system response regulator ArlR
MTNILIIEDEIKIARFLELELNYEGYSVALAHDGRSGLEQALAGNADLIILDLMLPQLSGIEVCRRIRQNSEVPIIMLTAKDDVSDKVTGLDMGADDYMTKPFAIEELLARIRNLLQRCNRQKPQASPEEELLKIDRLVMNPASHKVTFAGQEIILTKREYDLLEYLLLNQNVVLTREKLLDQVWGYDYMGDTNVVDVYIRYLRSKIDDPFRVHLIHTVRGVGYVLRQ